MNHACEEDTAIDDVSHRYPPASSQAVRDRMRRTRRRDTSAELAVRSALHRRGLRYRVDVRPIQAVRSRADLVFRRERVAVFIDGCFWHGCPRHGTLPRSNRGWWREKIAANVARDRRADAALEESGWSVVRVWEHEDPELVAERIADIVADRR